jgi:arginyl-tRNA synthetase
MSRISVELTELVHRALVVAECAPESGAVEPVVPSKSTQQGDFQSNACFRLAKQAKCNPRALAERVVACMPEHPGVEKVEVAGPGFLNFSVSDAWVGEVLAEQMNEAHLGLAQRSGCVVVDYSSPNVAKRMHVAHLRSTVIGNALDRCLRYAGYTVIADNHIGDWGTQFGKLIVAWRKWVDEAAFEADPIGELQRIYVQFANEAELRPELEEAARAETAKLQAGDSENRALWALFIKVSMEEFDRLYARLGVHFDVTLGESFYNDKLQPMVDQLLESGVASHSQGAVIVPFEAEDGKGLKDTPMLIRKKDGAALYATTDLATVRHRIDTWNPNHVLYVTDTRQQLHFRQLFACCKKLGWTDANLIHVWFGLLSLPGGTMSTRKGNVINLKDLLDEAVRRARVVVDEKSPDLSEAVRADIAEAVGVGSVRYADLSQNPQSNVVFDWDKMLALDGNTAPYLLYTYARCRSLQAKGRIENAPVGSHNLTSVVERRLALQLMRFPEAVEGVLKTHRPNLLCDYLFSLGSQFNRFYYESPVLKAEGEERAARLALVEATARVLAAGLDLLGIRALERM